jgi:nitrate reductase delta subunit
MTRTLKALSALLTYPSVDLVAARQEIEAVLRDEGLLGAETLRGLEGLLADLGRLDLLDLEERYVELFDRTRRLSLNLFEHVHGESRDRGQAMIDLAALYEKGGYVLAAKELPDHLPAFLEYASTLPLAEARSLIGETAHILAQIEERLRKRGSAHTGVFAAIREVAEIELIDDALTQEAEAQDDGLAALDAEWEEAAVTFGPGDAMGGCSVDRLRTQIRAGRRDARTGAA